MTLALTGENTLTVYTTYSTTSEENVNKANEQTEEEMAVAGI